MLKKENDNKKIKIFVIILNVIGIICLVYFMIPFIKHDMTISNPNAMLAGYSWDACGFVLTLGLLPLVIANTMAYIFLKLKNKIFRILFYIPSLICLILVSIYLFMSFTDEEAVSDSKFIASSKCELNGKVYNYSVYEMQDETYSVEIDDKDKIPLSIIDYDSPKEIFESIEKYYKNNGGMCP